MKVGQIKSIKSDKNQEQCSSIAQINDRTIQIASKSYIRIKVLNIYSSVLNMEHAVKIAVCIVICCVFPSHTNGQTELNFGNTNDQTTIANVLVDRVPLKCQYNLTSGDHICDCDNRNTVNDWITIIVHIIHIRLLFWIPLKQRR